MSIYQKISAVMKDVEYLKKDDIIQFNSTKYKAISEEKVTTAVRESLVKNGVVIIPIEQEHTREQMIKDGKPAGYLTTVNVKYQIQNIDDMADFIVSVSSGTGVDTQDKGVGKAMTYAYKYLLLRLFAIPTGEDPDKISSAELDDQQKKAATKKDEATDYKKILKEEIARRGYDMKDVAKEYGLNKASTQADFKSALDRLAV